MLRDRVELVFDDLFFDVARDGEARGGVAFEFLLCEGADIGEVIMGALVADPDREQDRQESGEAEKESELVLELHEWAPSRKIARDLWQWAERDIDGTTVKTESLIFLVWVLLCEGEEGVEELRWGELLLGGAEVPCGAWHAKDDGRVFVLCERASASAFEFEESLCAVIAHAGEDDGGDVACAEVGDAAEEDIDRGLVPVDLVSLERAGHQPGSLLL